MDIPATDHLAGLLRSPPPRFRLANLPTPVEALNLPGGRSVWVKQDHLSSSVYGGGKVRKLEYILAALRENDVKRVLSIGAFGSHHLLALALHGRRVGVGLDAVVAPQVVTRASVVNLAATVSSGARLVPVADRMLVPWGVVKARMTGNEPARLLPPGGSDASGCMGFVEAGLELGAQVRAGACPQPGRVYVTAGTAGTAAGLVIGFELGGLSTHVRLVSAVEPLYFNRWLFRQKLRLIRRTLASHGLEASAARGNVTWSIDHGEVGGGYAVPTARGRAAVRWADTRGVQLETTYTGKCVAAMLRDLREGRGEGPVIYWHTHASTDVRPTIEPGWRARLPEAVRRWVGASAALAEA